MAKKTRRFGDPGYPTEFPSEAYLNRMAHGEKHGWPEYERGKIWRGGEFETPDDYNDVLRYMTNEIMAGSPKSESEQIPRLPDGSLVWDELVAEIEHIAAQGGIVEEESW